MYDSCSSGRWTITSSLQDYDEFTILLSNVESRLKAYALVVEEEVVLGRRYNLVSHHELLYQHY